MTSRVLRVFRLYGGAVVVMAAFSGVALAQGSATATGRATGQSGGAALPDAPSPAGSQMQPRQQAPESAQKPALAPQPVVRVNGAAGSDVRSHVIVLENTMIRVMTDQPLSTKKSRVGTRVLFTVSEDVTVNNVLVIPRGATVHGEVVEDKKAGRLGGSPALTLELESLDLEGQSYPLYAYQFRVQGASKTKPTEDAVVGGAYYGALAGGVVAGRTNALPTRKTEAEDMAAGAAAGAGAVAAAAALAPRPVVSIPAESQMDFYLASPISVQQVSEKEAERLAQRLHSGGPVLYVRGDRP